VRAAGDGYDITPSGSATNAFATVIELSYPPPGSTNGTGTGLRAQYWDNTSFSGTPKVTRTDPSLNFVWRYRGSPDASIPTDNFSARWTGSVQARQNTTYTFETVSDDTSRYGSTASSSSATPTHTTQRSTRARSPCRLGGGPRSGSTTPNTPARPRSSCSGTARTQRIVPTSQLYQS